MGEPRKSSERDAFDEEGTRFRRLVDGRGSDDGAWLLTDAGVLPTR